MDKVKRQFRATALERRDRLTTAQREDYSGRILKNLTSLLCYQDADAILTYVSFRSEVDTFPLIETALADGKAVFAPKVLGKEMEFYRIFSVNDLVSGYMGILEPMGGHSIAVWIDDWMGQQQNCPHDRLSNVGEAAAFLETVPSALVCMPGAAFDRTCHRIGYGGGFYDRYLSRLLHQTENTDAAAYTQTGADMEEHPQLKVSTAAMAYGCQIFEEIPWESHDIRPICVVTEKELLRE